MQVQRSSEPVLFFSKKEKAHIVAAIQTAEQETSGEIRVHLERKAKGDIFQNAKAVFQKIGMAKTKDRNGVLIFMGIQSKRFCVLGDTGIHEKVPPGFWDDIVKKMVQSFKRDEFADGLADAILLIGEKLKAYFPHQRDDVNELPDEISCSL